MGCWDPSETTLFRELPALPFDEEKNEKNKTCFHVQKPLDPAVEPTFPADRAAGGFRTDGLRLTS